MLYIKIDGLLSTYFASQPSALELLPLQGAPSTKNVTISRYLSFSPVQIFIAGYITNDTVTSWYIRQVNSIREAGLDAVHDNWYNTDFWGKGELKEWHTVVSLSCALLLIYGRQICPSNYTKMDARNKNVKSSLTSLECGSRSTDQHTR